MTEKRFELRLCSNGRYYLYKNNDLVMPYVDFDKFNKESADVIVTALNMLVDENEQLNSENDSYKNMFFEIVETALTDKNCRELYCKGILDIFDKTNSLNQAREMIKEHLK